MQTATTLVLITIDPCHALAYHAVRYCTAFYDTAFYDTMQANDVNTDNFEAKALRVFFYGESARLANRLNWNNADQINLTTAWQHLHKKYDLALPVCVSTALSRGITDSANAKRHQLTGDNLAEGFELVGLGVLADLMQCDVKVVQF